jgi:hypothetical protein
MMAVAALALAIGSAQAIEPQMKEGVDFHGLQASNFQWSRGDHAFDVCDGSITFTNTGSEAIGNIRYRTFYVSETGVVHENSFIDAVIEKLIQPGETRTIQLESFVVPNDAIKAGIVINDCEVLAQFTKPHPASVKPDPSSSPDQQQAFLDGFHHGDELPQLTKIPDQTVTVRDSETGKTLGQAKLVTRENGERILVDPDGKVQQQSAVTNPAPQPPTSKPSDFIIQLWETIGNHNFAALAPLLADGGVNYFGSLHATDSSIAKEMASDARRYGPWHATYYPETFTREKQGAMIYESITLYNEVDEPRVRMHRARLRFTVGFTEDAGSQLRIHSLVFKVI